MNDNKSKFFFFQGENQDLLGYIKQMLKHGFIIPFGKTGIQFKFLGYSSSQLKSHSFWFLGTDS